MLGLKGKIQKRRKREEDGEEEEREHPSFTLLSGPSLKLSEALFQLSMVFWTYQDPAGDITSLTSLSRSE